MRGDRPNYRNTEGDDKAMKKRSLCDFGKEADAEGKQRRVAKKGGGGRGGQ